MSACAGDSVGKVKGVLLLVVFVAAINLFLGTAPCSSAEDLYDARLDEGLSVTEPYSYLLIAQAHHEKAAALALLEQARRYSPDLPAVYFEIAREAFSPSANGIFRWFDYSREGVRAYWRNFWWKFSISALTYGGLLISFALSMVVIIAIRVPVEKGLILHDAREERKRLMLLALPLFLSVLGPIALITGLFFIAGFYFKKENKAVVYLSFLFCFLFPFLQREVTPFFYQPSSLKSIVAVNEGKDNKLALWAPRMGNEVVPLFSYALALKREGEYQKSIDAYKSLVGRMPKLDARVQINLGNAYYGLGNIEEAKASYLRAIGMAPLPSAFYNLSQIYRGMLDFTKGDEYFREGAKQNPEAVSRFAAISANNPNRFVVDETLPGSLIWEYAMKYGKGSLSGIQMLGSIVAVLLTAGFYFLDKLVRHRAQRCKRCGDVYCSRCSRVITWGEMCPRCFGSLVKIDEVDSRERITRLLSIYQSQMKRRRRTKLMSYLIPGGGQIYSGKILVGLLFLWPFMFSVTLIVMDHSPISGLSPFRHVWLTPLMVACLLLLYWGSIFHIRRRIYKGWL